MLILHIIIIITIIIIIMIIIVVVDLYATIPNKGSGQLTIRKQNNFKQERDKKAKRA